MIAEYIEIKKQNARGMAADLLNYIMDNSNEAKNKNKDTVKFLGSSHSLCSLDPFNSAYPYTNKASSNEPDLKYFINEFNEMELKNRRVKKPLLHIVLSLRKGECLTKSQWSNLVKDYVEGMGYVDHHWLACMHSNTTDNQHAHIVICAIENFPPHRKLKDGQNFKKSALLRHELEKKYSLQHDNNPYIGDICNKVNNPKIKTKVQEIRAVIDLVLANSNGQKLALPDFINNLINKGVGCHVNLQQGDIQGMSFSLGEDSVRASKLGKGYRFRELETRGLYYNKSEHWQSVEQSNKLEIKITNLIKNGFKPASIDQSEPNKHYMLIPNSEVKKYPLNKKLHSYQLFNLWLPVATQGKTKQQIESDILQMKMIRLLLKAYFHWLNTPKKLKHQQSCLKFKNPSYGISKGVKLSSLQLNNIVKSPSNFKTLNMHDSLLISKEQFIKLKNKDKKLISKPPSQDAMEISIF